MPRIDWKDEIQGGLAYMQFDLEPIAGFADPFSSTIDAFNQFRDPQATGLTFSKAVSMGESLLSAANTGGWGVPAYESGFDAAMDFVYRAKEFLATAVAELSALKDFAAAAVQEVLALAGQALNNVIGPAIGAITGAIPIIGQVVQAVAFVFRSMKRLLRWLNRSGPRPKPPEPFARPVYSADADLDCTRSILSTLGMREPGSSPNMSGYFSPPVWPDTTLNNDYVNVCTFLQDAGIWGLIEVARLDDGTKLVRLRNRPGYFQAGGWAGQKNGYGPYAASFPSLVPGTGLGKDNPSMAHTGMLVLSRDSGGRIEVTDLAARFPQFSAQAGPVIGQLSRYGPSLYSIAANTLRRRWLRYLHAWYHGLALAAGQPTWGAAAGVTWAGCYDIGSEIHYTFQWRNKLEPQEAWAIRRYFGQLLSSPKTPVSNAGQYPELNMGIASFDFRDVLLHPETSIPYLALEDLHDRQMKCLRHGATPLYLQTEDDALGGSGVGEDFSLTLREAYNDRIDELFSFATAKDAGIVCSPGLEPSMVISPQIQALIQQKRLSAGAGSLSACQVHKMSQLQIQDDPATPAQPGGLMLPGAFSDPGGDKSAGGGLGIAVLALFGLVLAGRR
jgi:hypothetical protein